MLSYSKHSSMLRSAFVCVLLIAIQGAISAPAENSRIPPVDLNYECVHATKSEDGKVAILLLHGFGASLGNWDGTYEALAFKTGRRVCRADLRNQGDSPWDDETSVAAMTEDVVHLLDTLGEETAVIVGHSLGGKIAMHTALNYPDRVHSIVTEDISPNLDPEMVQAVVAPVKLLQEVMQEIPEGFDEEQATKIILAKFKELFKQFFNQTVTEEELADLPLPFTCADGKCRWKANYDAFAKTFEKGFPAFWTESTGLYEAPALFIYGTQSPFKVNEKEDDIRKLFPNAKLVGIEKAGHVIHALFPQFEDEVLRFLEETDPVE